MARGRPAKPTMIHVLNGNPSKIPNLEDKLDLEPKFEEYTPDNFPPPPRHLPAEAKKCWNENAPLLASQRLLTKGDLIALETYCFAYYCWLLAVRDVKKAKSVVYTPYPDTSPMNRQHMPAAQAVQQFSKQMLELAREFGMTPAARGRMTIPEAKKEVDAMERLLREG